MPQQINRIKISQKNFPLARLRAKKFGGNGGSGDALSLSRAVPFGGMEPLENTKNNKNKFPLHISVLFLAR